MYNSRTFFFIIILCFISSASHSQNMLSDADFENGLSGWNLHNNNPLGSAYINLPNGTDLLLPPPDADHGTRSLKMYADFGDFAFGQAFAFQLFPVCEGNTYDACVDTWISPFDPITNNNIAFLRVAFFSDAAGANEISGVNSAGENSGSPTGNWSTDCIEGIVAPPGATHIGYYLFFQRFIAFDPISGGIPSSGSIIYDNATLIETKSCEVVPTMGEWGLVSLAFLLIIIGVQTIKEQKLVLD